MFGFHGDRHGTGFKNPSIVRQANAGLRRDPPDRKPAIEQCIADVRFGRVSYRTGKARFEALLVSPVKVLSRRFQQGGTMVHAPGPHGVLPVAEFPAGSRVSPLCRSVRRRRKTARLLVLGSVSVDGFCPTHLSRWSSISKAQSRGQDAQLLDLHGNIPTFISITSDNEVQRSVPIVVEMTKARQQ
jgi:hypothetical protein